MIEGNKILEKKRIKINKDSLEIMKDLRDVVFPELCKKNKALIGMTFLGSRIHGLEKPESDLDIILVYDGSFDLITKKTEIVFNKETFEFEPREEKLKEPVEISPLKFLNKIGDQFKIESNMPISLVRAVNVSPNAIKETIKFLKNILSNKEEKKFFLPKKPEEGVQKAVWNSIGVFLFGFGGGLKEKRRFFLESLQKEKKGEEIFSLIMNALSGVERTLPTKKREGLPEYARFPKTIKEAFKFFNC